MKKTNYNNAKHDEQKTYATRSTKTIIFFPIRIHYDGSTATNYSLVQ